MNQPDGPQGEIVICQTDDGQTKINVRFVDETVWLTQAQLVELFQTSKANVSEHIKNIFTEGELEEKSVVRKFRTTAADGKSYSVTHYNLDMIISLGYRVKSSIATHFRRWAPARLREYIVKGFTMDDDRLKNLGGGNYWKELLERIRDIRSSEKVFYRQVLDLYATSADYDPHSTESTAFFKLVQNKLHYAAWTYGSRNRLHARGCRQAVHGASVLFRRLPDTAGHRNRKELPDARGIGYSEQTCLRLFRFCGSSGHATPPDVHARLRGAS